MTAGQSDTPLLLYSSNGFKFRAVSLVMLVLYFSERWRVERALFPSFVWKSMFLGVSLTILQLQFISIISSKFVISILKHIFSEDCASKL
jgi:hypothetical protein